MSWQGEYILSHPSPTLLISYHYLHNLLHHPQHHQTAYVDQSLVGSGKIARAAILGQKGGVWATSPGYTVSTEVFPPFFFSRNHTRWSGF